jgi:hypothetical protein
VDPADADTPSDERWSQRIAPIAAAVVVLGGIAFLVVRSGSGESSAPPLRDDPLIVTVAEPDEPGVDTTVPSGATTPPPPTAPPPTAPPLIETTTTSTASTSSTSVPDTVDSPGALPTQADVDAALLRLDDLAGVWTEEVPDVDFICGDNPEAANVAIEGAVLFQQLSADPIGVRQMGHTILSFVDEAAAQRAFDADLELLEACSGTTVDLEGVPYRVEVRSNAFDEAEAATFPCSEQNASVIIELTNDAAPVPYIGQSGFSFRCGPNVSATSLTTSLDVDDLNQPAFFAAGAIANTRASQLPGSG